MRNNDVHSKPTVLRQIDFQVFNFIIKYLSSEHKRFLVEIYCIDRYIVPTFPYLYNNTIYSDAFRRGKREGKILSTCL